MTITARYASQCSTCHQTIQPGQQIEWTRGVKVVRHTSCDTATTTATAAAPIDSTVIYEVVGARVYVLGQTYPIRDAIRAAGGHWDTDRKAWWIGATKRADLAAAIATAIPVKDEPRAYRRPYGGRRSSGGAWTGCACGSREGQSRDSDCDSCRFDEEDN
jgi:hypothetical protein